MPPARASARIARSLRAPGYLILASIVVQSILDIFSNISPLLPHLVAWRVRAMGLSANALTAPLLAFLLLYVLALTSEHRVVLWILSIVTALSALALAVGSGILALDAVQLGHHVAAAQRRQYAVSILYALFKLGIGVLSLLTLTWVGFKAARALKRETLALPAKPNLLVRTPGEEPGAARIGEPAALEPPVT